jgi:hypothetical protein
MRIFIAGNVIFAPLSAVGQASRAAFSLGQFYYKWKQRQRAPPQSWRMMAQDIKRNDDGLGGWWLITADEP